MHVAGPNSSESGCAVLCRKLKRCLRTSVARRTTLEWDTAAAQNYELLSLDGLLFEKAIVFPDFAGFNKIEDVDITAEDCKFTVLPERIAELDKT